MTALEQPMLVLSNGCWRSTEELVQAVRHRFSAAIRVAEQRGDRYIPRNTSTNTPLKGGELSF